MSGTVPCGRYSYTLERVRPKAALLNITGFVSVEADQQWHTVNPDPTLGVSPDGRVAAHDFVSGAKEGLTVVFEGLAPTDKLRWLRVSELFGSVSSEYRVSAQGSVVIPSKFAGVVTVVLIEEKRMLFMSTLDLGVRRKQVVLRVGEER